MPLLSIAIWLPIVAGVLLLAFGRDDRADAVRWAALIAATMRRLQTGHLYWYALVMIVGVIGLMTWQLWPFLGSMIGR